ncbi:MAG: AEC family transporter [Ectothiorhodospiraceae bacterium]|nr:AEC family transporter [Chromatiales bacterium]MCP5157266.1 AEC family transporter [Ectothiorhodospiraceae bacterium]
MQTLLDVIAPIFGVIAIGFVAARGGLVSTATAEGLSSFVFRFAIPALLFRTLAHRTLPDALPWGLVAAFYGGVFATFAIGWAVGGGGMALRGAERALFAFSGAFGNVVLLGVPLALTAFGDAAALPTFMVVSFHSLLLMPTVTVLLELARGHERPLRDIPASVARGVLGNPIVVALIAGSVWSLAAWPLGGPVDAVLELLARAALPCALFAMGASLARLPIGSSLRPVGPVVVLKTLLCPALVGLLAGPVLGLDPLVGAVAVLMAAQPTGINPYLFAQRYGQGVALTAAAVVVSTAFSVVTLSLLLAWQAVD